MCFLCLRRIFAQTRSETDQDRQRKHRAKWKHPGLLGKSVIQKRGESADRRRFQTLTTGLPVVLNRLFGMMKLARPLKAWLNACRAKSSTPQTQQNAAHQIDDCGALRSCRSTACPRPLRRQPRPPHAPPARRRRARRRSLCLSRKTASRSHHPLLRTKPNATPRPRATRPRLIRPELTKPKRTKPRPTNPSATPPVNRKTHNPERTRNRPSLKPRPPWSASMKPWRLMHRPPKLAKPAPPPGTLKPEPRPRV